MYLEIQRIDLSFKPETRMKITGKTILFYNIQDEENDPGFVTLHGSSMGLTNLLDVGSQAPLACSATCQPTDFLGQGLTDLIA